MDELFKEALAEKEDDDEYEDVSEDEEDGEERDFDSDFGGRSSDEEDDEVPDLLDARGHRLFMEEVNRYYLRLKIVISCPRIQIFKYNKNERQKWTCYQDLRKWQNKIGNY